MAGVPWVAHEWLPEVIFAWLYDSCGWAGLAIITALIVALAVALLFAALLAYVSPAYALIGAIMGWGLCFPHLLARPHVFVYPILVIWTALLVAARVKNRAPSPFCALVMLVWANVHGSFIFGLGLAALFVGEALFDAPDWQAARQVVKSWSLFGLFAGLSVLVTPNGLSGLWLPFETLRARFAISLVTEWQSPDFQKLQPLEVWLMLVLLGALISGLRLPITRVIMLLILLHMALQHLRHSELLGFIAPLIVAPALAPQLPRRFEHLATRLSDGRGRVFAGVVVVALAFAVGVTVMRVHLAHATDRFTPAAAVAAAKQYKVTGSVLNDFNFGGFLIFAGIPTFIDGRFDVYGDDFIRRYNRNGELARFLTEYKIGWTLFGKDNPKAVMMDYFPGWKRIYSDNVAVVHVRDEGSAHSH
jgi:hypothetical protein